MSAVTSTITAVTSDQSGQQEQQQNHHQQHEQQQQLQQSDRQANSIQVSLEKNAGFYSRIGRRMMHGSADGKPTFDEIIITGLGMATKTAIGTASLMERDKQGFIKTIETSYFASVRGGGRRLPKVTITMIKNPDAPNLDAHPEDEPATATA